MEELNCLAVWKEGSAHYLVGKMSNKKHHNAVFKDDNTYRCFVSIFSLIIVTVDEKKILNACLYTIKI